MWVERAARVGLIAASQFIEIKVQCSTVTVFNYLNLLALSLCCLLYVMASMHLLV